MYTKSATFAREPKLHGMKLEKCVMAASWTCLDGCRVTDGTPKHDENLWWCKVARYPKNKYDWFGKPKEQHTNIKERRVIAMQ